MSRPQIQLTGQERTFNENDVIVSKTDVRGIITYANRIFLDVAGYRLSEVIGQPHNMVRNPNMPRSVFKLLWDTLQQGKEIFAYVVNSAKNGDHYWVFAHVTPSFDAQGKIIGYHSNRRVPRRDAIRAIEPVYQQLLACEAKHQSQKEGMAAATAMLLQTLKDKGVDYDRFILSI